MRIQALPGVIAATAVTGALLTTATASAESLPVMEMDINLGAAQAYDQLGNETGSFSQNFTGTVEVIEDADTFLAGMTIDGVECVLDPNYEVSDLLLEFELVNGQIVGGSFLISVSDGLDTDSFAAGLYDENGGQGNVVRNDVVFDNYLITAGLSEGEFTLGQGDSTFAGCDISQFLGRALGGGIFSFNYEPDAEGYDEDADIDLLIQVIPLPAPVAMGLAGLAGVAIVRRRRSA